MKTIIINKTVIVAVIFFVLGAVVMHFYYQKQLTHKKTVAKDLFNSCYATIVATGTLYDTCNEAYEITQRCVVGSETCDLISSKKRLVELNEEKNASNEELRKMVSVMEPITKEIKTW